MSHQDLAQSMQALAIANQIRLAQAVILRELGRGEITLEQALRDNRAAGIRIGRLLASQRGWGDATVHKTLKQRHISPARRIKDLTGRQVDELCAAAADEPWPRWKAIA